MTDRKKWTSVKLGSVADVIDPHPSHRAPPVDDDGIPFPGIGDFERDGSIDLGSARKVAAKVFEQHAKRYQIGHGDIGFGRVATIGKVVRLRPDLLPFAVSPTLAVIRPRNIHADFLFHCLQGYAIREQIRSLLTGTTRSSLGIELLRTLEISVPSEPEQIRIATILSLADSAVEESERAVRKNERVKLGLMQNVLTRGIDNHGAIRSMDTHEFKDSELGKIPVEWDVKPLSKAAKIIDPNPSHRYPPYSDIGVPIASTENFKGNSEFDLSFCETVPYSVFEAQDARCNYKEDDVVFARKGRLGFARPYGTERKVFSHTVVILKPHDQRSLRPRFLLWLVRFREFFDQIDRRMNSNSGVPTLGVGFLGLVPIVLPEPDEQDRICAVLDELETSTSNELRQVSKLMRIRAGLIADLLNGGLTFARTGNQNALTQAPR